MPVRRNRPMQVETLESLTLLSGLVSPALTHAPALISAAAKAASVALNANTAGAYIAVQPNADSGLSIAVQTKGPSTSYGQIGVAGKFYTPGFVAQGRTVGTIVVYTGAGNLTLAVSGPLQNGFSGLPTTLNFTITGGTGKFKGHFGGTGTVAITLLNGFSGPKTTTHGSVTLVFKAT